MKIAFVSIFVDDQQKALDFYTEVLGFVGKADMDLGEFRWLTLVSPEALDGVELVLEPSNHRAVGPFRSALVADGIPFTSFEVESVAASFEALTAAGVEFTQPPTPMGPIHGAVFDDTCGNLIMITSHQA
ncbi:VOC family protein [soil metagenome]